MANTKNLQCQSGDYVLVRGMAKTCRDDGGESVMMGEERM